MTSGEQPTSVSLLTPRLELSRPTEADRARFIELFCDEDFMVFSSGALTEHAAHARFERMLSNCAHLSFAKQPVIERSTGLLLGYSGVDWFDFEGRQRLEFGYRLVPVARGMGYATEAGEALLTRAARDFGGEVLAIIDPINQASRNVIRKLGFAFWKEAVIDDCLRNIYRCHSNRAGPKE